MTPLRVLLVDDEPLARMRLRALLDGQAAVPTAVVGEAGDTEQALALLQHSEPVDLLLLDIRMPGRDGLRLARVLRTLASPPAVVFVTAHAEHALMAFELEALDYLTKPVRRERLQAALHRAWQRQRPADSGSAGLVEGPVLVVADRGHVLRLPLAEVLYLRAELKYVTLRTATSSHLLDDSLAELEQRLAALGGGDFVRIHRNALVALRAIRQLALRRLAAVEPAVDELSEGWAVRVAPLDEWLAVSRRQLPALRAALVGR